MPFNNDRNRPVYMIGVAAELAGIHPQTLRSYEQRGLVNPQRTSGNTRMYSQADIERLELITELTDEGINVAGVIRILDLQGRLDERDSEIDDLHKKVRRLADRVHELETRQNVNSLVDEDGAPMITVRRLLP
ncbi:heat shock protein transcriptional repressor HspR [Eggerthellaceae bacterium PR-HUZ602407-17]|nr:HTH-type transcriptional regulator glnR [Chlamydia trachomatis]